MTAYCYFKTTVFYCFTAKDDREKYYMDVIEKYRKLGKFPCGTRKLRVFEALDGEWFVNMCQEDTEVNELDAECVTKAEISQRMQIAEMFKFLKETIPAFKNITLVETAS